MSINLDYLKKAFENGGNLPKLYKTDMRKRKRMWEISVIQDDQGVPSIVIHHGIVGGKIVERKRIINKGKNKGRRNETTPFQQAIKEAFKAFSDKFKDMTVDIDRANEIRNIYPMLARDYKQLEGKKSQLQPPFIMQPKLDGVRCLAHFNAKSKSVELLSRDRKIYNMPHITKELNKLYAKFVNNSTDFYLDGELYNHDLPQQKISGIARKIKTYDKDIKSLEYWVFDCFYVEDKVGRVKKFIDRYKLIETFIKGFKYIKLVKNKTAKSVEEFKKIHEQFIGASFEGSILRDINGKYKLGNSKGAGRSTTLQKYKTRSTSSGLILDIIVNEQIPGGFSFYIYDKNLKIKFKLTASGTLKYRNGILKNKVLYINKFIEYTHKDLTSDGIPKEATPTLKDGEYKIH